MVQKLLAFLPKDRRQRQLILGTLGVVIFLTYPFIDRALGLELLGSLVAGLIFVILALGLNIVVGFAGLLDLGYAAFFAIGAYTMGIFTWPNLGLEWSFWVVIWICAVVAAICGMIIGAPTLRLRGDYLAIVTLAFGEIVPTVIRNLDDLTIRIPFTNIYLVEHLNLTNGPQGLNPVGRPSIFGFEFGFDPLHWWYLVVILGVLVIIAERRLENSRLGRAWMAIREDEIAADAMGVDPIRTKLLAFALGASFSGFAGAIYASMIQAIFPELFRFQVSIFLLIIVILSGMGNVYGVLVGGLLLTILDRVLIAIWIPQWQASLAKALGWSWLTAIDLREWRWVLFGVGLILIMVWRPEGLFPSEARKAELHEHEWEEAGAEG
ncbi:MAG: branched-chain amino acid ABC transporter permease [Ardenticatenia bacterium]|nr:MAG: branched-chain amino acid ABC transporter permease [Ardenticatenia bacterium]